MQYYRTYCRYCGSKSRYCGSGICCIAQRISNLGDSELEQLLLGNRSFALLLNPNMRLAAGRRQAHLALPFTKLLSPSFFYRAVAIRAAYAMFKFWCLHVFSRQRVPTRIALPILPLL